MILEFSIENTYSIKERQTISFEAVGDVDDQHIINAGNKKLLKLAAVYGANASGKSNILKAFDFYIQFILDSFTQLKPDEKIYFEPFFFDETTRQSSGFFEIVFYLNNNWYKYQIRLNKEKVLSEYLSIIENNNETVFFSFDHEHNKSKCSEEYKDMLRFVRPNTTFLSTAAQFNYTFFGDIYQYLGNAIVSLGESALFDYTRNMLFNGRIGITDILMMFEKAGIDHISGMSMPDRASPKNGRDVIKILTDAINGREIITGQPLNNDGKDNAKEFMFAHAYEKIYILPFLSESMGTRRLFELAGPLWDCMHNETNLFIDEIESSLHDDLLEFFIRSFIENTKDPQLLFTTHNQNLLDSPLLRNDEVWFAQKDNNGGSEFFSMAEFKDVPENVSRLELYKAGTVQGGNCTRRELYKAGTFGALPRTARFFKD